MNRARNWLAGRPCRQRLIVALAAGASTALAFPPFSIVPVLVPAFVALVWLAADAGRARTAGFLGLAFGFGQFLASLYWITEAFYVIGGPASVAAWPAVVALSLYLAVYPAVVAAAARIWLLRPAEPVGIVSLAGIAGLWTLAEGLRGWAFTGFPWNPMGNVWVVSEAMLQPAAVAGVYGLSMVTVFAAASPVATVGSRLNGAVAGAAILGLLWASGTWRLTTASSPAIGERASPVLRLVQPSIPQRLKWRSDLRARHVQDQFVMSRSVENDAGAAPDFVIWAETAIPFYVNGDRALLDLLASAAPEGGLLIAGGLRRGGDDARYNSIFAVDGNAATVASYDKVHLVPFGEYMPLADVLPFGKLTAGTVDFTPGARSEPMVLPGLATVQPLICFEIIFPGSVVPDGTRPDWLLNLTNDAWYGDSIGPYQHFAIARLRAVEEGLPLVRVANTGISGVVDGHGRVVASLPLGARGILDVSVPAPLTPTVFARIGNILPLGIAVILIVAGVIFARRARPD